ncbi:MAG: GAK system CofD-like protein [candidate division Zixibacteria bacterium]|nr:GAK system CofD-like protein [candidate division Zixibacteria bacterium]
MRIKISREIDLPDPIKLDLYRRSPQLGPKILFFSGGNALRETSRALIDYTHNSIHIVTPFDSGGSSAALREAFRMPAIGDVRNRLMALADQSILGNPEIFSLFSFRFPKDAPDYQLQEELTEMVKGRNRMIQAIIDPMRKIIKHHLSVFRSNMPPDFDLRGASIGNLILTAGYIENERRLDPVIYIFSKLVEVRGTVRPVTNEGMNLVAELESGETVVGQHLITGKEHPPISSKITRVYLTDNRVNSKETSVSIRDKIRDLIESAQLICYPMGSFYSSIIANLLPSGVGEAIAQTTCPKVFVPNTYDDPETYGLPVDEQIETLLHYLMEDNAEKSNPRDYLNYIVVDKEEGAYQGEIKEKRMEELGIEVINYPLIDGNSSKRIDPNRISEILLTLA